MTKIGEDPEARQLNQLYASPDLVVKQLSLWTLRGTNRAGKSLFLAAIKEENSDDAVILFPHTNYLTEEEKTLLGQVVLEPSKRLQSSTPSTAERKGLNDGDRILRLLNEVVRDPRYRVICLDEFDNHLQVETLRAARLLIDQSVKNGRSVVEIRHRLH